MSTYRHYSRYIKIDEKRTKEAKLLFEKERKEYLKENLFSNIKNTNYYDSFAEVNKLKDRENLPKSNTGLISITNNLFNCYIWESDYVGGIYVGDSVTKIPEVKYALNCALALKNKDIQFDLKTKTEVFFNNKHFYSVIFIVILSGFIINFGYEFLESFLYSKKTFHFIPSESYGLTMFDLFMWFIIISIGISFLYIFIYVIKSYIDYIKENKNNLVKFENGSFQEFNYYFMVITSNHSQENISEIKNFFTEEMCKKLCHLYEINFLIDKCKNGIVYFRQIPYAFSLENYEFIMNQMSYLFRKNTDKKE